MSDHTDGEESGPSHLLVETGVAALTLAFGVVILLGSLQVGIGWGIEGPGPGFFPFYISLFIIGASAVNLVQVRAAAGAKGGIFSSWEQLRRVMSVVVPATAYVAFVPFLGMYVSSMLLIGVFMTWLGGYRLWQTLPIAIGMPVIAYVVFERYFQIPLPKGPIEYWLGL
jgi:hypothetical protein